MNSICYTRKNYLSFKSDYAKYASKYVFNLKNKYSNGSQLIADDSSRHSSHKYLPTFHPWLCGDWRQSRTEPLSKRPLSMQYPPAIFFKNDLNSKHVTFTQPVFYCKLKKKKEEKFQIKH